MNFVKFLRTSYLQNYSGRLVLTLRERCKEAAVLGTNFYPQIYHLMGSPIRLDLAKMLQIRTLKILHEKCSFCLEVILGTDSDLDKASQPLFHI